MPKTLVEKVPSKTPDVAIFKISGTLGYHENEVLIKFFRECSRKRIKKLIVDFSELGSLGGGCARIIRDEATKGTIVICIAGASTMVQNFLTQKGTYLILFEDTVQEAVERLEAEGDHIAAAALAEELPGHADAAEAPSEPPAHDAPRPSTGGLNTAEAIYLEPPPEAAEPEAPTAAEEVAAAPGASTAKQLQKKLAQYRSLFSLNVDFNRIQEKHRLLDAFLLTTIAQVGVESAAFLERTENAFVAASWKGFETADPTALKISTKEVDIEGWKASPRIFHLDDAPLGDSAKKTLETWGMPYVAPFIVYNEAKAIILLGRPIRQELDENSWDYLSILINQFAIAYENSCRFEEESRRTLGLVHSLISMIEENTLFRGSTETMVNYIYAVAVEMHYPEEHMRDLIYGTVLRDIGMIKVSDLIVRSPRELLREEWEIIKRHPIEGAALLQKMKFSDHTVKIVLCHHERYNGEGYPDRLQGDQIPLGARIVSVVESYAAMLQDRPTRPALSQEEALNTLKENWGLRYDPDVIKIFVDIVEEEIRTNRPVKNKGTEQFFL